MSDHDEEMWADYDRYEHTGECAEYFEELPEVEQFPRKAKQTAQSSPCKHSPKYKRSICSKEEFAAYYAVIIMVIILILVLLFFT